MMLPKHEFLRAWWQF